MFFFSSLSSFIESFRNGKEKRAELLQVAMTRGYYAYRNPKALRHSVTTVHDRLRIACIDEYFSTSVYVKEITSAYRELFDRWKLQTGQLKIYDLLSTSSYIIILHPLQLIRSTDNSCFMDCKNVNVLFLCKSCCNTYEIFRPIVVLMFCSLLFSLVINFTRII